MFQAAIGSDKLLRSCSICPDDRKFQAAIGSDKTSGTVYSGSVVKFQAAMGSDKSDQQALRDFRRSVSSGYG